MPATRSAALPQLTPEQWKVQFNLTEQDQEVVHAYGERMTDPLLDDVLVHWYARMAQTSEYAEFFKTQEAIQHVVGMQKGFWRRLLTGRVDEAYIESRQQVGRVHARIGLPLRSYFAGTSWFMDLFCEPPDPTAEWPAPGEAMNPLRRMVKLDTCVVVATYEHYASDAMQALSMPVMAMWQGCALLPVVGHVDQERGRELLRTVLAMSRQVDLKVIIVDCSGIPSVMAEEDLVLKTLFRKLEDKGPCEIVVTGVLAMWATKNYPNTRAMKCVPTLSEALMYALQVARPTT